MFDPNSKILIVDDMAIMRVVLTKALSTLGFQPPEEAENGEAAWTKIESAATNYDLVISDWNMPKSSGLDLLKKIRAGEKTRNIPFIMVTAEGEPSDVIEAIQAGASNYLIKPVTFELLKEKLSAVFKKHHG